MMTDHISSVSSSISDQVNKKSVQIVKSRRIKKLKYGDFCFLYASFLEIHGVTLEENKKTHLKNGIFCHCDIVGKYFGEKVYSKNGEWVAILDASPEIITLGLKHQTQIIYNADISLILTLLEALPGKNIIEAGTGSCSLTCSLSRAIYPEGKVFSFEFHKERYSKAVETLRNYNIKNVDLTLRDVCKFGFFDEKNLKTKIDAVFLDLPMPWLVVKYAHDCLAWGGKIVTFSPCIEQVKKTVNVLSQLSYCYQTIKTYEILCKPWGVKIYNELRNQDTSEKDNPSKDEKKSSDFTTFDTKNIEVNATFKKYNIDEENTKSYLQYRAMISNDLEDVYYYCNYVLPMRSHTSYITVAVKRPLEE